MAATNLPKTSPPPSTLLERVRPFLTDINLRTGETFLWSPKDKVVKYSPESLKKNTGQLSLLHEIAHAILDHRTYEGDFELLQLEVAAWTEAKRLAADTGVEVDNDYIEDCIDTYRDWLHQRSTCPTCGSVGLQHNSKEYRCHNCLSIWHVSESRFCRPYRMKQTSVEKQSPDHDKNRTTFR